MKPDTTPTPQYQTITNTSTDPDKCIGNVTLDIKRLYQSMPKRLQKLVSCHDLKLICDAYNGDQPPVDNQFVADGCEKFGHRTEESQDGATMSEWYGGFSKIESTKTVSKGTRIAAETRSACNDMTTEERKKYAALAVDIIKLHKPDIETTPEWRELGPDEVIGADDEYNPASLGAWIKVPHGWIGEKCDITRIRTRRPLPKHTTLESDHATLARDHTTLPKQEEIPLEKEISYLEINASRAADIHNHVLIVDCLRYLRDEIQKLKQK
jgi:hypothetical protein